MIINTHVTKIKKTVRDLATTTLTDPVKVMIVIAHIHEAHPKIMALETHAEAVFVIIHENVLITLVQQVVFDSKKDVHDGITNIQKLIYTYTTCHALDGATHNVHCLMQNVLSRSI